MDNKESLTMIPELNTNIVSNEELRAIMGQTLRFLSDTLSNTLGPYGTTTIIQDRMINHQITKDGYSLLRKIFIEQDVPRTILDMVKKISRNLVRKVGDGSTSSIIIANSLYKSITELINKHNIPPKDLLEILEEISEVLAHSIKLSARPISHNMNELRHIAAVSTNNDLDYGNLVTEIFQQVGPFGFINLEKSKTEKTHYEITRGFEIPRGYINTKMINQPDEKSVEHMNPFIFMCDEYLTETEIPMLADLIGLVCLNEAKPLVILAKGYDNAVATFFHINLTNTKSNFALLAVELAVESKKSMDRFNDLALVLGATPFRKSEGDPIPEIDKIYMSKLGRCVKVTGNELNTKFIEGNGDKEKINARVKVLESKIEEMNINEAHVEFDKDIFDIRKRMATLQNSMAILYVGGTTEDAKDTDKYLLEDAVFASRSALKHGYIPGGNLIVPSLLKQDGVRTQILSKFPDSQHEVVKDVISHLYTAFLESFTLVLNNAYLNKENSTAMAEKCIDDSSIYNLKTSQYESFDDTNIINSAETDIEIMKGAISIIGLLATSNQFIRINTRH